jgi:Uncharacterised protein family
MLYLFRILLLLIDVDQETVLNWFGIENAINQDFNQSNFETSTDLVSLTTFRLILESLSKKVQDGLTLGDIESILIFTLFIRFLILATRYNLKTSFYITCIGLLAGFLWYRHLVDTVHTYRLLIIKIPFVHKLAPDATTLFNIKMNSNMSLRIDPNDFTTDDLTGNLKTIVKNPAKFEANLINPHTNKKKRIISKLFNSDLKSLDDVHWFNLGKILYSSIKKGIVFSPEAGERFYIDPLSMIITKLPVSIQIPILSWHDNMYNHVIPKIFSISRKYWNQLSNIAIYALITRIGKRYCPYLVRWHWSFLILLGMMESLYTALLYRIFYFTSTVVRPQVKVRFPDLPDPTVVFQYKILNLVIMVMVVLHIGFILFALFHAIWGQYFYFPFMVENTELHTGPRSTTSIYSGGQTAWQNKDEQEQYKNRFFPKVWYGWFGRGTKDGLPFSTNITKFIKKMIKKLRRKFQR